MNFAPLYEVDRGIGNYQTRRAIDEFLASGAQGVAHSRRGLLLHHICNYCIATGIGFHLEFDALRDMYVIRRRCEPGGAIAMPPVEDA
jgi:hypothetical protein